MSASQFFIGQRVSFGRSMGEILRWDDAPAGKYRVRDALTGKTLIVDVAEMAPVPHRVGPPSWADMTPFDRALAYPGRCCDCGKVISISLIRCEEHDFAYRAAIARAA